MKTCRPHLEKLEVVWGRRRKEEAGVCRRHSAWARSGFFLFQRDREFPVPGCCHHCTERAVGLGGKRCWNPAAPARSSEGIPVSELPLGLSCACCLCLSDQFKVIQHCSPQEKKKKSIILEIEAWNGGVPKRSHLNVFTIIIFLIIACFWYIREKSQSP